MTIKPSTWVVLIFLSAYAWWGLWKLVTWIF